MLLAFWQNQWYVDEPLGGRLHHEVATLSQYTIYPTPNPIDPLFLSRVVIFTVRSTPECKNDFPKPFWY